MNYSIFFEKKAFKQLKSIDKPQQKIILNWIDKNLKNTNNPSAFGRALKDNLKEYWRYRLGKYRLVAEINDREIKILIIAIGHRNNIYKNL